MTLNVRTVVLTLLALTIIAPAAAATSLQADPGSRTVVQVDTGAVGQDVRAGATVTFAWHDDASGDGGAGASDADGADSNGGDAPDESGNDGAEGDGLAGDTEARRLRGPATKTLAPITGQAPHGDAAYDVLDRHLFGAQPAPATGGAHPTAPAPWADAASMEAQGDTAAAAPTGLTPVEVAAAGATIGVLAWASGLLGAAVAELRRLPLLAAAGYTRLTKGKLLDHDLREALYTRIREGPGVNAQGLVDATGAGRSTALYHLRVLEREGLITSRREGRFRLYFAAGSGPAREQAPALAALASDTARGFAEAVGRAPGVDQQGLCETLGVKPSLAHWHAERLADAGVVEKVRDGRRVRYYPGEMFQSVQSELSL